MAERAIVQLLVPGALGPWPDATEAGFPLPQTPSLRRLLAVADRGLARADLYGLSWDLFGLRFDADAGPPTAPLSRIGDGFASDDHYWLRADPVHLIADLQTLRLAEPAWLDLLPEEADALATTASELLEVVGAILELATPQRWYLRLAQDPGLRTRHWANAVDAGAEDLLPTGPGAPAWRRLLTEVQMALAVDPVNDQREQRGAPPVNGLWVWGGGRMPQPVARCPVTALCAADPILVGLARLCDVTECADFGAATNSAGNLLVHDDAATIPARERALEAWIEALEELERRYFEPLLRALRGGTVDCVELYPLRGTSYRIRRRMLRRFWRSDPSLCSYL